jgi:hypothetical protein
LTLGLNLHGSVQGYETDQFTHRLQVIDDSKQVLNEKVNAAIADVIADWRWKHNEYKFAYEIYRRVGGLHWVDRLERWAMNSDEVAKIKLPKRGSIYHHHPFWATRVAFLFGIGDTLKVDGTLIGTDKFGHFFSQGLKFYRRFKRYESEAKAAEHSAFTERAIFGQMTTGSYSNADLVANYEGHRFYRSLFESNIVGGKPAILRWTGSQWQQQRPFDWSDHINDFWDEALNINHYDRLLAPHIIPRIQSFCPDYRKQPESFAIRHEDELKQRYQMLQLRDTSELRLDQLCKVESELGF